MSPHDSLTRFAALAAHLGEPFADRPALLLAAGLDERRWAEQVEQWSARLNADASGELHRCFAEAYARALAPRGLAPARRDPRFLGDEVQPWREEAAAVGAVESGSAPPPLVPCNAPCSPQHPRDVSGEQTQECPIHTPAGSVLPFDRASASSAGAPFPGRRLHRFDPQTGLPLPAPVWVDLPLSPSLKP
jgi:hypothetical protein